MCGFGGYVDLENPPDPVILREMIRRVRHRGPDEQNIRVMGPVGMAHARLSVLDLEGSHQPMADQDHLFVYNGEAYNYEALKREEFLRDQKWITQGDSEVVMNIAMRGDPSKLLSIDGMFAYALWSHKNQSLFLGRDRFGKKPLYYSCPRDGLIVFGSEPKVVLAHPEVSDELDEAALCSVAVFRAIYSERSAYRNIHQLPAGHHLKWDGRDVHRQRYYNHADLLTTPDCESEDLASLLRNSVQRRLVSDVPVGAFLSGGIDSSLLVALMRDLMGEDAAISTFSVSFQGDTNDEASYAQHVADLLETKHRRVVVGVDDFVEKLPAFSQIRDAPLSEPADVAVAMMSEVAKQHVKVALSGEGADEGFAGYPKYLLANTPAVFRRFLRFLPADLLLRAAKYAGLPERRMRIAVESLRGRTEIDRLCRWFGVVSRDELQRRYPGLSHVSHEEMFSSHHMALAEAQTQAGDAAQRMQYTDILTWLPGNLLERGDRMSMAAGLEVRMPFMNADVLGYGIRMPTREKVGRRETKIPLRRLCAHWVDPTIGSRKKWGFRVPLDQWFRGVLMSNLRDLIESQASFTREYGDLKAIRRILADHERGVSDHQASLWSLLAMESWYQNRSRTFRLPA